MDDKQTRGFGPEDSMLRDKSNPKGDNLFRDPATVDEATLRRIKFLRRLQELQEETKKRECFQSLKCRIDAFPFLP